MGQYNLDRILAPRSIAVIGASNKEGSIGAALMSNLITGGFEGNIVPVNPNYQIIQGLRAYNSVTELESTIDLAILATPIETVVDLLNKCVAKQMAGAVILSAGGKETGISGKEIEERIRNVSLSSNFRIIGPNCLGFIQPGNKLNASFVQGMPLCGNMAFISQSGAICSAIFDLALRNNIGFSHFISIGSMADVDFGDLIDYLGNHRRVKSILLYIESLTNIRKFMSAARAVSRVKPIIVVKAGRGEAGARAAASHTGAMVGEDSVYDAAFKRAGIVRVNTIEELFDTAELIAKQPRPRGPKLAIITNGGGPGVMAADHLTINHYQPEPLDAKTISDLDSLLPSYWSRNNPIDILGDAPPSRFEKAMEICINSNLFNAILVIYAPQALAGSMEISAVIAAAAKKQTLPIIACFMGGKSIAESVEYLQKSSIPVYDTPERAVQAFLYMVRFVKNQELLLEVPPRSLSNTFSVNKGTSTLSVMMEKHGYLPQSAVIEILANYSLPLIRSEIATGEDDVCQLSTSFGYPVVMKLASIDIPHKTEAGGVWRDLRSEQEVRLAYTSIIAAAHRCKPEARIEGVMLQPYVTNPDYEIVLGAKRDRDFGPVILFGIGGVLTEIIRDTAIGLVPMNRLLAKRLMQEIRSYALFLGYRNIEPLKFELLEEMIIALSQMLIDFPQIAELDMNPVLIQNGKPVIVDTRIFVSPSAVVSPMHLVISPYPSEYECHLQTEENIRIFVRPVKPEDAFLFQELFQQLSPTSIYYRFFGAIKTLEPEMLWRFTQIDYDREIALVALDDNSESEKLLGVARIIGDPDGFEGEFAVMVGDPWQGKGIGARLLQRCLLLAARRGFKKVYGLVLKGNTKMLALGKKLGFTAKRDLETGEYELHINLDQQVVDDLTRLDNC